MLWQDPLIWPLHFIIHPALLLKAQSPLHPNECSFPPASALLLDPGQQSAAWAPGITTSSCKGWAGRTGRAICAQQDALMDGKVTEEKVSGVFCPAL